MRKTLTLLLVAFCLTAKAQNSSTSAAQSEINIIHVTVIDSATGKEATDQTVVISDGKISDVAQSKNLATPTSARIVDGRGKYLIPGLWDMHVHTWDYESTYPLYIANGVTGVRDMFGPPDANKFRAELNKKQLIAPHFYLASPIVDGHPPVWPKSIEVTTPEQGRKVVDDQQQKGADFIKVYSRLTPDSYSAIAAESARVGIPFEGHVPNQVSAWKASDAKQKSFEHLYGVAIACSAREQELQAKMLRTTTMKERQVLAEAGSQSYSESKCNDLFARLRANSNWQVPTLSVFRPMNWNDPQLPHDPRLRYFSGEYRDWLTAKNDPRFEGWTPEDFALERQQFDFDKKLTGAMFRAGVPLLAGTDTGNPYCFPGFSLHDELALLVESGLTPLAALQAATRNAAIFMNAADRYGSISKGKVADMVLLDADPLEDIHNTTKILEVFLEGKEYDRPALDSILRAAESMGKTAEGAVNTEVKGRLSPEQGEVWERETAYFRYLQAKDLDGFMSLWHDRFVGWPDYMDHPVGKLDIRASVAEEFHDDPNLSLGMPPKPEAVEIFGDVAVTHYLYELKGQKFRVTHTWLKGATGWRIIAGMSCDVSSVPVVTGLGSVAATARQTPRLKMPGPEAQNLMLGAWSTKIVYPPSPAIPNGDTGEGTEIWRPGPGGRSVIEEYRERNAHGDLEGLAIAWWDKKAQGQRFVWCDNSNPDGCYVSKEVAKWDGNDLNWREEQALASTNRVYSETFKDITANSFTQVLQEGEPGQALQNTATISAVRKSEPAMITRRSVDDSSSKAESELRDFMNELRRANIQGDVDAVANSITDDYIQTDINGYRQDKAHGSTNTSSH